jgi:hypothetical protein
MAKVSRFVPKGERIAKEKAETARQAVLDLKLPPTATEAMLVTIARHERGGCISEWKYNMLNPAQCLAVWDAIRALPAEKRPHQVRHLFDLIITHLEPNTGLVILTREELAEQIGTEPANVSRMMGTLEHLNVIFRERVKVAGMRGPGIARYRVNQWIVWNGSLEVRQEQAKAVPVPFELIDGGKP